MSDLGPGPGSGADPDLAADGFPLTGNPLIEASAGTGKTYTITNLYIRLLLGHGRPAPLPVNQILVLTFTIAATEELKHRIRSRIVEARRVFAGHPSNDQFLVHLRDTSPVPERDAKLLTAASQLMDDSGIFTIHGFCARVLSELSFETGVLFEQNLEADRDALLQTAAEDCFRADILTLPQLERALALNLWPSPEQLIASTRPFLFREQLRFEPPQQDVSSAHDRLLDGIEQVKTLWLQDDLPRIIRDAGFRGNRKQLSRIDTMTHLAQSPGPIELNHEVWSVYNREAMAGAIRNDGTVPEHPIFDLFDEIHGSTAIIRQIQANLWHLVTDSLRRGIARSKARNNELTLDDLLLQLHAALQSNHELAVRLRHRWPVAMIDEFQDTDDLQYSIFSRIYGGPRRDSDCLLFIGDPKQAIYQFRGADIYTYLNARKRADEVHALSVNWRSTGPLVAAINHLFGPRETFGTGDIQYRPNSVSPAASGMSVTINGKPATPINIALLTLSERLFKPRARTLSMADAAENIVRLLTASDAHRALINDTPIHAGQIAVLVRDRNDAAAARTALAVRGIRSVYVTLESVFLQDTAEDLRLILEAVIDPASDRAIKAALATNLLRSTAEEIDAVNQDVIKHQQVLTEFQDYHRLWATRDVAPMIEALILRRGIADKWLHLPGGERQITNLRHLAELLQERSARAPGMHRLLKWFTREKIAAETVASEERQLRLESDEHLVKIVTMHAAKGLEYDIVMIPMAGFIAQQRKEEPALYHALDPDSDQSNFETRLDFCPDEALLERAQQEKYEEDMRLLYVAITRARYLCYLGIADTPDLDQSAVGKLLDIADRSHRTLEHLRQRLPDPWFSVTMMTESAPTRHEAPVDTARLLPPPVAPTPNDTWRVHSYTGVSRRLQDVEDASEAFTVAGYGDDDQSGADDPGSGERFNRFAFPRGPRVGVALHSLLEDLPFDAGPVQLRSICEHYIVRMGVGSDIARWTDVLTAWMEDILGTPLPGVDEQFTLRDIQHQDRINELEFHFPLDMTEQLLVELQQAGYLGRVVTGRMQAKGMMTGLIDLIVRRNGRYYLMDYKSNYLGDGFARYGSDALAEAVTGHHYDLQYLIYALALHRYLTSRLADYDYSTHFGGVLYLFLRGMSSTGSVDTGVYSDRPSFELIERLDDLMGAGTHGH